MRIPARTRARVSALVLLFVFSRPASPSSAYAAPVGKFRDAAGVVIQATREYFTGLNKVERDKYIYGQAGNSQPIRLRELEAAEVFSKEGIAARVNALDELANYTDLLYELATGTAPDTIKTQVSDLQTALTDLSGHVQTLTGRDDTHFVTVTNQVLPILGEVLKRIVEKKQEHALKQAVEAGADPVNKLIDAIGRDARFAYQRKRSQFSSLRVIAMDQYNREFVSGKTPDPAKLKSLADQISAEEDRWEVFLSAQPTEGLQAMMAANQALVRFAKIQKPTIPEFAALSDAIDAFASTAKRVGQSVQELSK